MEGWQMRQTKYKISMARIRKIRLDVAGEDFDYWASLFGSSLTAVYKWESPSLYNRAYPKNQAILMMLKMEHKILCEAEGVK